MSARRPLRARQVWTPEGLRTDAVVEVAGDRIVDVRPARPGDPAALDGLLVPPLVNLHTHLELSHLAGRVPGGDGFVAWVGTLFGVEADGDPEGAGRAAAAGLRDLGTGWVGDVSNRGHTAPWLRAAGLSGVVHHELLTFDRAALPDVLATARAYADAPGDVVTRPSPHALFSTAPELVRACVDAVPGVPATIHVGESEDEEAFLRDGTGPHAALLDHLGRDWRWWEPPGVDAVAYLDGLGVLGPRLLLVHGVHLSVDAFRRAAAAGAPFCLCPRSNRHVVGRLPDVPALLAAGARFGLGTDSLASCPDLDVLGEIPVLVDAFPDVPVSRWLTAATHGGAACVGWDGARLEAGARAELVLLEGELADLGRRTPARTWVAPAS